MVTKDIKIQLNLDVNGFNEVVPTQEPIKSPKKAGRPPTGIKRSVYSTSLDNELIQKINDLSKATGITKAILTERAFEMFFEQNGEMYEKMFEKQK